MTYRQNYPTDRASITKVVKFDESTIEALLSISRELGRLRSAMAEILDEISNLVSDCRESLKLELAEEISRAETYMEIEVKPHGN